MKSPSQIAWFIPVSLFLHQVEEYVGEFPMWYSDLLNAQLSNEDFLIINGVGLFIFTVASLSYYFNNNKMILAALGTLAFVNGVVHLLLSLFTFNYSPGTVTGVFILIPLGIIIFKEIFPRLTPGKKFVSVLIGIFILILASTVAMNI